ncbi:MAG: carboxymuconolactone decarboxylase family protein [Alphaproteobacteria bacterium]|nr:carboxymuconolactone decarboxylase family protein [Alphaproteobacteria bacterium]
MSLDELKNQIPDYAKDIRLNLSSLMSEETLSTQQLWGCFVACAMATRQARLVTTMDIEAAQRLTPDVMNAARAAAAIMGMNNVYYRFTHLAANTAYRSLPARLRMNVIANPGVPKADFELWSLAVSALNGCGMCIDSHEAELRKHGLSTEQIQTAVRIAATMSAVAMVLDAQISGTQGLALAA